jgi:hypothetical protein
MRKISLINTRSLRAESPDSNHNESNNHRTLIKLFSNSSQGKDQTLVLSKEKVEYRFKKN